MALTKIRQANKKYRHEARRRKRQAELRETARQNKIIQKRTRKMMLEGRKEFNAKRRDELEYVDKLTAEVI